MVLCLYMCLLVCLFACLLACSSVCLFVCMVACCWSLAVVSGAVQCVRECAQHTTTCKCSTLIALADSMHGSL